MTARQGGGRERPLIPNATRTLPLAHAFDLAVSTVADLAEGEAVEWDGSHAVPEARCVVRCVAGGSYDISGVPFDLSAANLSSTRQAFAGVWLEVEESAPTATHATVRRYAGER